MKNLKFFLLLPLFALGIWSFQSCTDLEVETTDSILTPITGNTFAGDAGALLASAYRNLNQFQDQDQTYSLTAHTTDEMIPPTRGTDWGDNGVWRTLHAHTWDATHDYIRGSWNRLNGSIFLCNQVLASTMPAPTAQQAAEAKFLRAFYMFHVMDFWGKVPFRNVSDDVDVNPRVYTRSEAFDFVEKDLTEALADLPALSPGGDATLASKASANALLAKLYLNKAVYKADNPAGPYTFDNADMAKVITHCDAVIAAGFSPDPDYFNIFKPTGTKETILTANGNGGSPSNRYHMTLHYDQSGWNGFTTLADFYNKFETGDQRKGKDGAKDGTPNSGVGYGFLVGQQFTDAGAPITNSRDGKPLVYTPDVPLAGANTAQGIRVIKYHAGEYGKYIFLRFADVWLMKAEAQLRSGGDALTTVNTLRGVRGASTLGSINEAGMLDERGRELYWEGWRRNDQVRFGTFDDAWSYKSVVDPTKVLFPIPDRKSVV